MSKLDQAKKEAIRLFKIAKSSDKENPNINIRNLSQAREYISILNGYKNWNQYEKRLKIDDLSESNIPKSIELKKKKNIINNIDYFDTIPPFVFNKTIIDNKELIIKKDSNYTPIIIGHIKNKEKFSLKGDQIIIDNFPLHVMGNTGSGLTETTLSTVDQMIKNNEGIFYVSGREDHSLYARLFSYADEHRRLKDLYFFNFMADKDNQQAVRLSNTIDPINPLIDYPESFDILFGKISKLLHSLCNSVKINSGLVTIENFEAFLSLDNLVQLKNNELFVQSFDIIEDYLIDINYYNETENAKKLHAINCIETLDLLDVMKNKFAFNSQPDISIDDIYKNSKICLTLFPSLEKSPEMLSGMTSILLLQMINSAEKYNSYNILQNILFYAMDYMLNDKIWNKLLNTLNTSARLHFYSASYIKKNKICERISEIANTSVVMKLYEDIPDTLKLKIFDYIDNPPPLLRKKDISGQGPGEAVIFTSTRKHHDDKKIFNKKRGYYLLSIKTLYKPSKSVDYIYLPN